MVNGFYYTKTLQVWYYIYSDTLNESLMEFSDLALNTKQMLFCVVYFDYKHSVSVMAWGFLESIGQQT